MVETITPAVCGSRKRQLAALAFFALGAVGAAAGLGALLGLAGAAIGTGPALVAAIGLAVLSALREAGIVRFPLPQARRQVPERWRFTLPLPVWATGYGAGLGLGFLTYQPVATFWVACTAALALGRPVAGAVAFALYGIGRTAVLLLPARRGADATAIVERLAGRRRTLLRANAVALAACACLLAAAPVAGAVPMELGPGNELDPSKADSGFAYTQIQGQTKRVQVRPADGSQVVTYDDAESPSLYGGLLAYQDAQGIRVVRWRDGQEVARLNGDLSKPALDWPYVVFRRQHTHAHARTMQHGPRFTLHLRNLQNGTTRDLASGAHEDEIGRPSIAGDRIAWHYMGADGTRIILYRISSRARSVLFRSSIWALTNPALSSGWISWVRDTSTSSTLFARRIAGGPVRTVVSVARPRTDFWFSTADLDARTAYVTRWNMDAGVSRILREGF